MPPPDRRARPRRPGRRRRLLLLAGTLVVAGITALPLTLTAPDHAGDASRGSAAPAPQPTPSATPAPTPTTAGPIDAEPPAPDPDAADPAAAPRQAALVAYEDGRLLDIVSGLPIGAAPYTVSAGPHRLATTVLTPRRAPYYLNEVIRLGAARRTGAKVIELDRSLLVAQGATLVLDLPGQTLRLLSGPDGFASLVAWRAGLVLGGTPDAPLRVSSWSPRARTADRQAADGRAYIRVANGDLHVHDAVISDLGFWSGRTGGLAVTGSSTAPASGTVTGTTVLRGWYGLFASRTNGLLVTGSRFSRNVMDGVLVHRGTVGTVVTDTTSSGNGGAGFAVTRGASTVELVGVTAQDDRRAGIVLDGRPLSDGVGASGASPEASGHFRLEGGTVSGTTGPGVLVDGAQDAVVGTTSVTRAADGIVVRGAAQGVTVYDNRISAVADTGVQVLDGAKDVTLAGNDITGAATGIRVRSSQVLVDSNRVRHATQHGLTVTGRVDGSTFTRNTVSGAGSSGLDFYRVAGGSSYHRAGNDETGWVRQQDLRTWAHKFIADHPLLPLWVLILLLPVGTRFLVARRTARLEPAARAPYQHAPAGTLPHGPEPAAVQTPAPEPADRPRLTVLVPE